MNTKFVAVLGGIAAVVVVLAIAMKSGGGGKSDEPAKFFPNLPARVNDAASVTIRQGKSESVLERRDGAWVLASRSGYPVEFDRLKKVILGLADLTISEPKTSDPEFYSRLEVQDPTAEDQTKEFGGPMVVTVKDSAGATLAAAIIGKTVGGEEAYARRVGEAASFQIKGKVLAGELAADPLRWVDRAFVSLEKAKVESVLLASQEAMDKGIIIAKATPEATEPTLTNIPEGRQANNSAIQQTVGGLSYVSFEDVAPVASLSLDGARVAEFRTTDGSVITARLVQRDGEWWSVWAAGGNDEAETLNRKLAPWAFKLPEFKAKQLAVDLQGLLQALPPAPASPGAAEAPEQDLGPVGQ